MPYRESITTFLDILGFRELINSNEASFILEVLKTLRTESQPSDDDSKRLEIKSIAFSDSIVRAVPIKSNGNLRFPNGLLYYELFQLAYVQSFLIFEYGVFLRGAVTIADICVEDGIVFGPAVVTAYELESSQAIYPRILVDSAVFDHFRAHPTLLGASHHTAEQDFEYLNHYAIKDDDGRLYINYLSGNHLGEFQDVLNVLDRHYMRIKAASEIAKDSEHALNKYRWCANYHNQVVQSWSKENYLEYDTSPEDYILTNKDVPGIEGWILPKS